jgi:hypothetical protein
MAIKAVEMVTAELDLKTMALNLMRSLQSAPEGRRSQHDFHPVQPRGAGFEFSLRDWGTWESEPDSDDEDDDWQVLTERSQAVLKARIAQATQDLPIKVHISPEEKNWITFIVVKK